MSNIINEDAICCECGVLISSEQVHTCYTDEVDVAAINRAEEEDMNALFMHDNFCGSDELPF